MLAIFPVLGKLAVKYLVPLVAQQAIQLGFKGVLWGWEKARKKKPEAKNNGN